MTAYCAVCEELKPLPEDTRKSRPDSEQVQVAFEHGGNPRWVKFDCGHGGNYVLGRYQP